MIFVVILMVPVVRAGFDYGSRNTTTDNKTWVFSSQEALISLLSGRTTVREAMDSGDMVILPKGTEYMILQRECDKKEPVCLYQIAIEDRSGFWYTGTGFLNDK